MQADEIPAAAVGNINCTYTVEIICIRVTLVNDLAVDIVEIEVDLGPSVAVCAVSSIWIVVIIAIIIVIAAYRDESIVDITDVRPVDIFTVRTTARNV